MLYDLNIAWSPSTTQSELTQTLKFSASLGYNAVALNHLIENVPPQPKNPLPRFPSQTSQSQPTKASIGDNNNKSRNVEQKQDQAKDDPSLPTVLHRATVCMSDPAGVQRIPQLASLYDIVAVRPTTEKEFSHACQEVRIEVASLISLDLTQRFPFHFRPKPCMAAVSRGLRFEVCYGQTLRSGASADPRTRATWIGNLMELVRATRGRGIVISSEARRVTELRGPADVVNLLAVWGLPADRGMEGLGVNARGVVVNEGINRRGYRGVVDIVQVAARDDEEGDKMEGVETTGEAQKGKAAAAGGSGKKRKGGANEGRGSGIGNAPPADGTMSKRQAKKLKKLAMEESGTTTPEENKS
ncbi:RNase P subunit p30-domain-containing protein [Apiospora rasikravindrae]|uniref:RNase P subunit p30-domain-containing protein n=1 Tax=Apiospora rasikravindrae TaxID=990691 RepID=A0ABR1RPW1_9PEZI